MEYLGGRLDTPPPNVGEAAAVLVGCSPPLSVEN